MRAAYANLLPSVVGLAATNLETGSSADNLFHPYLELSMDCTTDTTVVSGTWAAPQEIRCAALAFHNIDTAVLTLKDLAGSTIDTITLAVEEGDAVYYFTGSDVVYGFSLALDADGDLYLGHLFLGDYLELPDFSRGSSWPVALTSEAERSRGGQLSGLASTPLQAVKVEFPRIDDDERVALLAYVWAVQTVVPHMVDFFPDSHAEVAPLYCAIDINIIEFAKRLESGFWYALALEWKEAR